MITVFIITGLSILVLAFALICLFQKADIEDLKNDLHRAREMYMEESSRNIEQLRKNIFRDDMELLNTLP